MECWPRFAVPGKDAQYEGWPRTISQLDNYGRAAAGHLPMVLVDGLSNPVLRVFDASGELVYALRIKGTSFRPKVFDASQSYRVEVGNASRGFQVRTEVRVSEDPKARLRFRF